MPISRDEVLHVARLARLELSEEELESAVRDLGRVLEYVERLGDPENPAEELTAERNTPLREDVARSGLSADEATGSAPQATGGLFKVPAVIGGP